MSHDAEPTIIDDGEITRVAQVMLAALKREPQLDKRLAVAHAYARDHFDHAAYPMP